MKKCLRVVFVFMALTAPALAWPGLPAATIPTAASPDDQQKMITAAKLRAYLNFIASDELKGRDTPSEGLKTAAKYIASHLSSWGLKPGGDNGSYFQNIALERALIDPASTRARLGDDEFTFGEDFIGQPVTGEVTGALVYASHGWIIKDKEIDPYAGIDVSGKIVVIDGSLPRGMSWRDLSGKRGENWFSPMMAIRERGALGAVFVAGYSSLLRWQRQKEQALHDGDISVVDFAAKDDETELPEITAGPSMLEALFRGEDHDGSDVFAAKAGGDSIAPFALSPDKILTFRVGVRKEAAATQNVIAILEGRDRKLKDEYVAIGAHYDHVGIGRAVNGDNIYNGADDDGSGTVSVLSIAEAFVNGPRPRRSILFIWHAGEEKGLWGSRYFTENPTVPIEAIVTQLNIDMIGRSKPEGDEHPRNRELSKTDEIYVIGSKMMSTELGEISERVNKSFLNLNFNYKYDDPKDPNRFFFRSDHFNYAKAGIPIIFYFDGVHQDYHRPSDHADMIDYGKLERVSRTIFMTAMEIAKRKKRLVVDKTLPAELMSR